MATIEIKAAIIHPTEQGFTARAKIAYFNENELTIRAYIIARTTRIVLPVTFDVSRPTRIRCLVKFNANTPWKYKNRSLTIQARIIKSRRTVLHVFYNVNSQIDGDAEITFNSLFRTTRSLGIRARIVR